MVSRYSEVDKGYAFVILTASFLAHVLQYGVVWTVGVFFAIFVEVFPENSGIVALISSLNTAFYYGAGPLASFLTNKYGPRVVAIGGGMLGSSGLILSMYANNVYTLYVTFGIITGFGLGLSYIPVVTILGSYFEKYRSIAIGVAVAGCGAGTFIFPPLIRFFIYHYGWRGSLLLVGGITLNMCVCGALLRPFEEEPMSLKKQYESAKKATEKPETKKTLIAVKNKRLDELRGNSKANSVHSSLLSILDSRNHLPTVDVIGFKPRKNNMLNMFIFRNHNYALLCLNNFLLCFGLSIVYVHLAAYSSSTGIEDNKSALLFSVIGISNFFGRIAFGGFGHTKFMNHTGLYTLALFLAGLVICVCPAYSSYAWLNACAASFGFLTGSFGALLPQVIIQILELQYLTSGYGYLLIFEAMGTLLGAPVAGWLYVWSDVYSNSLFLGGTVMMLSSLVMVYTWLFANGIPVCCSDSRTIGTIEGQKIPLNRTFDNITIDKNTLEHIIVINNNNNIDKVPEVSAA